MFQAVILECSEPSVTWSSWWSSLVGIGAAVTRWWSSHGEQWVTLTFDLAFR